MPTPETNAWLDSRSKPTSWPKDMPHGDDLEKLYQMNDSKPLTATGGDLEGWLISSEQARASALDRGLITPEYATELRAKGGSSAKAKEPEPLADPAEKVSFADTDGTYAYEYDPTTKAFTITKGPEGMVGKVVKNEGPNQKAYAAIYEMGQKAWARPALGDAGMTAQGQGSFNEEVMRLNRKLEMGGLTGEDYTKELLSLVDKYGIAKPDSAPKPAPKPAPTTPEEFVTPERLMAQDVKVTTTPLNEGNAPTRKPPPDYTDTLQRASAALEF